MITKHFSVTYSINNDRTVVGTCTYAAGVSVEIDPTETASSRHFKLCDAIAKTHWSVFGKKASSYDVIMKCIVDLTV